MLFLEVIKIREDLFLRPKPIKILFELFNKDEPINMNAICRATEITYPYLIGLIEEYAKAGIVTKEKKDRSVYITLTTRGFEIVSELKIIYKILEEIENGRRKEENK